MVRTYGKKAKGPCRSEDAEQIDCMNWLEFNYPDRAGLCFHPANEVTVDRRKRGWHLHLEKRKRKGVKPGVVDIVDLYGTDQWRSGVFELKALDGVLSKDQREFLQAADERGCFAAVCYGFEQFKVAWLDYLHSCAQSDIVSV